MPPFTGKCQHMTITKRFATGKGWEKFNLNVGGFVIKNCRWKPKTGAIAFPKRRDKRGRWKMVVHAYPPFLKQLRALLQLGQSRTPRDRRKCTLTIHRLRQLNNGWCVFGFTVRSVTIWGCRWDPLNRSIQLPITFLSNGMRKKRVVHAPGVHILRLRAALVVEAHWHCISCIP
jgi:hypothetical protein